MDKNEARRILAQKLGRGRPPRHIARLRKQARRVLAKLTTPASPARQNSPAKSPGRIDPRNMNKDQARRILAQKLGRGRPPLHIAKLRRIARRVLAQKTPSQPKAKVATPKPAFIRPAPAVAAYILCVDPDGQTPLKKFDQIIRIPDLKRAEEVVERMKRERNLPLYIFPAPPEGEQPKLPSPKAAPKTPSPPKAPSPKAAKPLAEMTPEEALKILREKRGRGRPRKSFQAKLEMARKVLRRHGVLGFDKAGAHPRLDPVAAAPLNRIAQGLANLEKGRRAGKMGGWEASIQVKQRLPLDKRADGYYYRDKRVIFRDTPILDGIYPGHGPREIIWVNPNSPQLKQLYTRLKDRIKSWYTEEAILRAAYQLVVDTFHGTKEDRVIDKFGGGHDNRIDLAEFIAAGQGSCRHRTLTEGALLSLFKAEFPSRLKGKMSADRNSHNRSYHVWLRYTGVDPDKDELEQTYILDAMHKFFGTLEVAAKKEWPYLRETDQTLFVKAGIQCFKGGYVDKRHDSLIKSLNKCLPMLQQKGYNPEKCLACGQIGCALSLPNGDVIKITTDDDEANLGYFISSLKADERHPSLPVIKSVFKFPSQCNVRHPYRDDVGENGVMWAIVREDLKDARFAGEVYDYSEAIRHLVKKAKSNGQDYSYDTLVRDSKFRALKAEMEYADQKYADNILSLHCWAVYRDITLRDLHNANWGFRSDGTLVARDIGFAELPGKYKDKIEILGLKPIPAQGAELVGAGSKLRLRRNPIW